MTEELKACPNPWCEAGEREGDFRPQVQYSNFGMAFVACTSCTMAGPTRQHEYEAIAAWNTRTPNPVVAELVAALETAVRHVEHMAAWIGKQNTGYSFEGLGEDMPSIRNALAKVQS